MSMLLHPSIAKATRLTHAGRLFEATEVLRDMLAGATRAPTRKADTAKRKPAARLVKRLPPGARAFAGHEHVGAFGKMRYRLYIPQDTGSGAPLVVMLHGCTQSPEDFAQGTGMNSLADEFGVIVAYPEQTRSANASKCWNWFVPGHQARGGGEPELIAGLTRDIIAAHGADPDRVYVAGLSAGGAAAAIMAETYPDLFAAVGVHSGLACGVARDLPSALSAMRSGGESRGATERLIPTITFHGDGDKTVHEANAREVVARATAGAKSKLKTVSETGKSGGGRNYTRVVTTNPRGKAVIEQWTIHGAGHAWSGGSASGSYTDPKGPDASRAMLRFFLDHTRRSG